MKIKTSWWWLAAALMIGALVGGGALLLPDAAAQGEDEIIEDDLQAVCVHKGLGEYLVASELVGDGDDPWSFEVTVDGSPVAESMVPVCEDADASFYVPAAQEFKIREVINAPFDLQIGLVSVECSQQAGQWSTVDEEGYVTVQPETESGPVRCDFTNETTLVCIEKGVGEYGMNVELPEDPWTFNWSTQGTDLVAGPLGACAEDEVGFYVAPQQTFELSESINESLVSQIGFISAECEGTDDVDGVVTYTAPAWPEETINCDFYNDSVAVCVYKGYGSLSGQLLESGVFSQSDVTFSFNGGTAEPIGEGCDESDGLVYYVAPGVEFTVQEQVLNDAPTAPVEITCSAAGEGSLGTADLSTKSITGQLDEPGAVTCFFYNDTTSVCVAKYLGDGALAAGLDASSVQFSRDGGTPEVPGPACAGVPAIQYFVAPGNSITIAESIPAGAPMAPVRIECEQFVPSQEQYVSVGTADLNAGSITIPTSTDVLGEIDCEFTNDSIVVCVTKQLNESASEIAEATDFTFTVAAASDSGTIELASDYPEQCLGDLQPEPLLVAQLDVPVNDLDEAYGYVVLPAGEAFTIVEDEGNPLVTQTYAACASRSIRERAADPGESDVVGGGPSGGIYDCDFVNESVLVCSIKYDDAAEFGISSAPTFSATADGVTVAEGLVPSTPEPDDFCFGEDLELGPGEGVFGFAAPAGAEIVITESMPLGSPVALVGAGCGKVDSSFEGQSVSFTHGEGDVVGCEFINATRLVCVTKTLDDGAELAGFEPTDFRFEASWDGTTASTLTTEECGGDTAGRVADPGSSFTGAFAVSPTATSITVTETVPEGAEGSIGATSIECDAGGEAPVTGDLAAGSITFTPDAQAEIVDCEFVNDSLIVCVTKFLNSDAVDAGYVASDFTFTVVDGDATLEPIDFLCTEGATDQIAGTAYVTTYDPASTISITEDETEGDVGLVSAECFPGLNTSETDLDTRTVVSAKDHGGSHILSCEFANASIPVNLRKELILDDGAEASVGDFFFDVYDADGAALETGLQTGATFYVAAGSTFTIEERAAAGFTTTAFCFEAVPADTADQSMVAGSVVHTASADAVFVECAFVNDDVPPIAVCAMLTLDPGSSDFTLDDFTFELYDSGAIVGSASAGGSFDADCEDTSDNTAEVFPGALVKVAEVRPDGSSYQLAASVEDPDGVIEFDSSSCDVGSPAATQALTTSDPVTFTASPGSTMVTCLATARFVDRTTTGGGGILPGDRPIFVEEPVAAAAPVEPEPAQALPVAVNVPIAVTGTSTTGVTAPIAFGLLGTGFLGLALGRRRVRRVTEA